MKEYQEFCKKMQKIEDVSNVSSLLGWDQETYMPPAGADFRARQIATISHITQELLLDHTLEASAREVVANHDEDSDEYINAQITLKDLKKTKKISAEFAAQYAQCTSLATHAWQKAKKEDDFSIFAPHLEKVIEVTKQKANLIDSSKPIYDVLLGEYEPGLTSERVDEIFATLKESLIPLYKKIQSAQMIDDSLLMQEYSTQKQSEVMRKVTGDIGFDYNRGRADLVEHPFCTNFSMDDVRITSRIKESDLVFGLWSSIHEAGHAMYEQGMPSEHYGLPLGSVVSMGLHESQSRLWENNIGHSREFVEHYFPYFQEQFPQQLGQHTSEEFYRALNTVKPWPIRIEADELTYHLHIIIRYEMERGLLSGEISVPDAPSVWNKKYKDYLGIDVNSDAQGILQDVHWSFGYLGYFPTYSVGSLYASQFVVAAKKEIGDFDGKIEKGEFEEMLSWLRRNIHSHGRRFTSEELCKNSTGKDLDAEVFIDYITQKMADIYNLDNQK